jgi:putative flavoprotein involved in K+ transport
MSKERYGTVVVGGGQAGLVMGYHLKRRGEDFVVLEALPRVGDVWRRRYDSLRLFSLPRYASLPGWRIPASTFPTRDEMADYLEAYAERFELPVRSGVRVERLCRDGSGFVLETSEGTIRADRVVVATGAHVRPRTPAFAAELDPEIRQLHTVDYRSPAQLKPGGVLVVGAANSGTDVALDTAGTHKTWIAGRHPGQVPFDIDSRGSKVAIPIVMFVFRHVLTLRTKPGRKAYAESRGHGVNLVRNKLADLDAAGIRRLGRIEGVVDGKPVAAGGEVVDVTNVVWATGSTPEHSWVHLPAAFGADGEPAHARGVATEVPGLYFLGLDFQFALASGQIQGLDRDARYLLKAMRQAKRSPRAAGASPRSLTSEAAAIVK